MQTLEQLIENEMTIAVERLTRLFQQAVVSSLEKQFAAALKGTRVPSLPPQQQPTPTSGPPPARPHKSQRKTASKAARRRDRREIDQLTDRFLEVVRSDPGQPMTVLAPKLGVSATDLQVPVARLKATKRVKTVGQRNLTRYFPVGQQIAA